MTGKEMIYALKKKFSIKNDGDLTKHLGITHTTLISWRKKGKIDSRTVATLVAKSHASGMNTAWGQVLNTIVEFYPIECHKNKIFPIKDEDGGKLLPYQAGLKKELDAACGVYVFYDSRGRVIYIGKTNKNTLWSEINLAFNRDRGLVQKIKRVPHPTSQKRRYKKSEEMHRQISSSPVPLRELASYFSAYRVHEKMINDIEALMVRCCANDSLNVKMEKLS